MTVLAALVPSAQGVALVATLAVIALGAGLRLTSFFGNRSLWLDEAMLARNILSRSMAGLAQALDYDQAAPLGYLTAVKAIVLTRMPGEYALRAVSLIAALGSLAAMVFVARHCFGRRKDVLFACALFALAPSLIYHAGEAKQYSTDVGVASVLLLLGVTLQGTQNARSATLLAVAGGVAVWLSHPAVFVLATLGVLMAVRALQSGQWQQILTTAGIGVVWVGSFAMLYVVTLHELAGNQELQSYWDPSFMPRSPAAAVSWTWNKYGLLFVDPFRDRAGHLTAWLFAVGAISLSATRPPLAWLAAGPWLFALAASAIHLYPFGGWGGRLLLFAVPGLVLGCTAGWQVVTHGKRMRVAGMVLAAFVFVPLLKFGVHEAGGQFQELRPLVQAMQQQVQPGDYVYVDTPAEPAYSLYSEDFGYLSGKELRVVSDGYRTHDEDGFDAALARLKGQGRVWLVVSQDPDPSRPREATLVATARGLGSELVAIEAPGASVRLFDFR